MHSADAREGVAAFLERRKPVFTGRRYRAWWCNGTPDRETKQMTRLHEWAQTQPDKTAFVMADTGTSLSYRELDERADAVARWLISLGLAEGATIALLLENQLRTFELWWGARRAGLYYVPISTLLTAGEVAYILRDCGASLLVFSAAMAELAVPTVSSLTEHETPLRFMVDGVARGFQSFEQSVAPFTAGAALPQRSVGREFMYSSGTTGFPKGIRRPLLPNARAHELPEAPRRGETTSPERDRLGLDNDLRSSERNRHSAGQRRSLLVGVKHRASRGMDLATLGARHHPLADTSCH